MNENRAAYTLGLVRDALGQGGIEAGAKLGQGLRVGSTEVSAGQGDVWLENSIRYSTCLSAGAGGIASMAVAGGFQMVPLQNEVWDSDNIFGAAGSTRMTIRSGGVYQVSAGCTFLAGGAMALGLGLFLNGTWLAADMFTSAYGGYIAKTVSLTWYAREADYFEMGVLHGQASAMALSDVRFSVARLA